MAKYLDLEADTTLGLSITDNPDDEKKQEDEQ